MFEKILIPLDGSPMAESVVPRVLRLLDVTRSEVILLRVIRTAALRGIDPKSYLTEREKEARKYLDGIQGRLDSLGVRSRAATRQGRVAETILSVTKQEKVDLLALATHCRTLMGRWLFGSVAERIRLHAEVPTLLLRPSDEVPQDWAASLAHRIDRILVPLDGSKLAEQALPVASRIAAASEAEIVLLQAVFVPPAMGLETDPAEELAAEEAEAYLEKVEAALDEPAQVCVRRVIPADGILKLAKDLDVDLLVMTSHGRGGASRFFLGSVTDRVVRRCWRPVLVIRVRDDGS